MSRQLQLMLSGAGFIAFLLLLALAQQMPGLFTNTTLLGGILALEIALVGLAHFDSVFFPLLMGIFFWAGTDVPFSATANSLRWLFLAAGAFGGLGIWIKNSRSKRFSAFHLVALFCVGSALVSAAVSDLPRMALLKVTSLSLLFLYASAGARLAIAGRERQFVSGLVAGCEWLVYLSAVSYFILDFTVFGNPNALGAVAGVVALPVLLWAATTAETRALRGRRLLALSLCGILLYLSDSRASILAATVAVLVFMIAARRQRLLFRCTFLIVLFLVLIAVLNSSHLDDLLSSFTGRILYKDPAASHEILESRVTPWAETISVVRRHPWFGSGFGTSELGSLRPSSAPSAVHTDPGWNREHGSSYLALAEYLGLLGALPFVILLLILLRNLIRTFRWVRANAEPSHLSVPLALVVIAGLVHAGFEDWLFAVGSYVCVFFWVCAFLLMDLIPPAHKEQPKLVVASPPATFPLAPQVSHSLR